MVKNICDLMRVVDNCDTNSNVVLLLRFYRDQGHTTASLQRFTSLNGRLTKPTNDDDDVKRSH